MTASWSKSCGWWQRRLPRKAQVFAADGTPIGSELLVNTATENAQNGPADRGAAERRLRGDAEGLEPRRRWRDRRRGHLRGEASSRQAPHDPAIHAFAICCALILRSAASPRVSKGESACTLRVLPQQSSLLACGSRRAILLVRHRDPGPWPAHPVP
jgi:hypothetical protein